MSFSNDRFQIFFNQNPLKRDDSNSPLKSAEPVTKLTFSNGGIYQTNAYNNDTLNLNGSKFTINTVSSDAFQPSTQSYPVNNAGYSTTYHPELYTDETLNYSDNAQSSTPIYNDDMSEDHDSPMLSNTKKIKKERLSPQTKLSGNKKNMQNDLKIKTKRNPWQPEEDEQVVELVSKYGQSWALIASLMKGRSGKQIRDRYLNKLKPDINKGDWTQAEDELLMSLCRQIGHKWSKIATYLPGRTEGQVKNRFYSHIKKRMEKNLWAGYEDEEQMDDENTSPKGELLTLKGTQSSALDVKEENFGFRSEDMRPRSIQTINCAGNYKILSSEDSKPKTNNFAFNSLNIKLNMDSKTPIRTFRNSMDPTDVISYSPGFKPNVNVPIAEEVRSPSSQNGVHLSSTRASSLSQDREFDEVFDKMASLLKKNPQANTYSNFVKPNGISFSISNGGIFSNGAPINKSDELQDFVGPANRMVTIGGPLSVKSFKEVNQLDFAGSNQHKFNVRIC